MHDRKVDATEYRIVGSLCYLVHTRSDLAFAIGFVSRFVEQHTEKHMMAVKRILRYVAGTNHYDLGYSDNDLVHTRLEDWSDTTGWL